jgi:hypothetical protein
MPDPRELFTGEIYITSVTVEVDVARKSSELKAVVRNVDLVPIAPYVADKAKAGIDAGTFNLDLTAKVSDNVVGAHGVLVVDQLVLHTGD